MILNAQQDYVFPLATSLLKQKGVPLVLAELAGAVIWWSTVEEWSKMKITSY